MTITKGMNEMIIWDESTYSIKYSINNCQLENIQLEISLSIIDKIIVILFNFLVFDKCSDDSKIYFQLKFNI